MQLKSVTVPGLGSPQPDGGKGRLDRIGGPQVLPMGSREVIEGQQPLAVRGQVVRGLGVLVTEGRDKAVKGLLGRLAGICLPDLVDHRLRWLSS